MKTPTKILALALATLMPSVAVADLVTIPAGTIIYGELNERVISKKKETTEGDYVRAQVWRNVIVDGQTVIKAGTPMMVRVSKVKKAKFAGIKGKLELEAVSVRCPDGTDVLLDGGYDKSGSGKKALSISLAALVAWPLVFIKGKQAVLETGTVFDAVVQADFEMEVEGTSPRRIRLARGLEVEILYDDMDTEKKSKILPVRLRNCQGQVSPAAVVTVNEMAIDSISIVPGSVATVDGCTEASGHIDLEALAKHFTRGINRFAVEADGSRAEVILDIEM